MSKFFTQKWIQDVFKMTGVCENWRTNEILEDQGFKKNFKIINVVGTNGKGSTTQYINDALIKEGYKVGKFTSPHLFKYNERITINNKMITDDEFFAIINPYIDMYNKEDIMFFPLSYIAAMKHFQASDVDFVVLEAGIGGLEDPTAVIDGDYGVLTSIDEDHMEWFKTRENIPVDKAGVVNDGMKFFMPSHLTKSDSDIFLENINKKDVEIFQIDNSNKDYQKRNQIMANAVIKEITGKDIEEYKTPFGRTSITTHNNKTVIYDVAHNEAGIIQTIKKLKNDGISFDQVVISLSKNKDDSNLQELFDVPVFKYQHSGHATKHIDDYKIKAEEIKDLKEFHSNIDKDTLYIGSFFLIHDLLKDQNE